jgi:hypothetical protein
MFLHNGTRANKPGCLGIGLVLHDNNWQLLVC